MSPQKQGAEVSLFLIDSDRIRKPQFDDPASKNIRWPENRQFKRCINYRSTSLSQSPREWRKYFELSEVRHKQNVTSSQYGARVQISPRHTFAVHV